MKPLKKCPQCNSKLVVYQGFELCCPKCNFVKFWCLDCHYHFETIKENEHLYWKCVNCGKIKEDC